MDVSKQSSARYSTTDKYRENYNRIYGEKENKKEQPTDTNGGAVERCNGSLPNSPGKE